MRCNEERKSELKRVIMRYKRWCRRRISENKELAHTIQQQLIIT